MEVRAFIVLDMPENIKKEVQKLQQRLPAFDGRLTAPENLHLTLKFLGNVDDKILIEVKRRLREISYRRFEAKIDSLGFFDRKAPGHRKMIIWLHVAGCNGLQKEIDRKLSGIFEEERRFMAHLTIARIKRLRNKNYFIGELGKVEIPMGLKFPVTNFKLMKSELKTGGPDYKIMGEYLLD